MNLENTSVGIIGFIISVIGLLFFWVPYSGLFFVCVGFGLCLYQIIKKTTRLSIVGFVICVIFLLPAILVTVVSMIPEDLTNSASENNINMLDENKICGYDVNTFLKNYYADFSYTDLESKLIAYKKTIPKSKGVALDSLNKLNSLYSKYHSELMAQYNPISSKCAYLEDFELCNILNLSKIDAFQFSRGHSLDPHSLMYNVTSIKSVEKLNDYNYLVNVSIKQTQPKYSDANDIFDENLNFRYTYGAYTILEQDYCNIVELNFGDCDKIYVANKYSCDENKQSIFQDNSEWYEFLEMNTDLYYDIFVRQSNNVDSYLKPKRDISLVWYNLRDSSNLTELQRSELFNKYSNKSYFVKGYVYEVSEVDKINTLINGRDGYVVTLQLYIRDTRLSLDRYELIAYLPKSSKSELVKYNAGDKMYLHCTVTSYSSMFHSDLLYLDNCEFSEYIW